MWSLQVPPVETWNQVVEQTGGRSYTRKACTTQSLQVPEGGRQDVWGQGGISCLQWRQARSKAHHLAGKVWGRDSGIHHSITRLLYITKQMNHTNQDVIGENCVHNNAAELVLTDKDNMLAWADNYARLLKVRCKKLSWCLLKCQPSSKCVCDPDLQSTQ